MTRRSSGACMATESIIKPGVPESKAPLKRGTMVGLCVIVLALLVVGALLGQSRTKTQKPVEETQKPLVQVGTAAAIDEEANRVKPTPTPMPTPVAPVEVRRSDSSVSMDSKERTPEVNPKDQLVSAGVLSKSLVLDDAGSTEATGKPSGRDQSGLMQVAAQSGELAPVTSKEATDHQSYVAAAVDSLRKGSAVPADRASSNNAWLKELGALEPSKAGRPKAVKGRFVLVQGMVIPAILTRRLNSDLPGEVVARVSVDVYDSFQSSSLLIPKGTLAYGQYSSGVVVGQKRLLFAFTRIVMPNRVTFDLPGAQGMDLAGSSGATAEVDNHFLEMFGSSLLIAMLGVGVENNVPSQVVYGDTAGGARSAAGETLVDVSKTILDRNRTIPPTLRVEAGEQINIQVKQDMEFPAPYRSGSAK